MKFWVHFWDIHNALMVKKLWTIICFFGVFSKLDVWPPYYFCGIVRWKYDHFFLIFFFSSRWLGSRAIFSFFIYHEMALYITSTQLSWTTWSSFKPPKKDFFTSKVCLWSVDGHQNLIFYYFRSYFCCGTATSSIFKISWRMDNFEYLDILWIFNVYKTVKPRLLATKTSLKSFWTQFHWF